MRLKNKFNNLIERSAHFMKTVKNEFKGNRATAIRVEDMRERVPVTLYETLYGVEA